MQTAWQRIEHLLRCTACEGGLDAATDGTALACRSCGERFPVINGIPCFVGETLVDYSELSAAERPRFLEMKKIAYGGGSLVGRMYNHYHRFAAGRRATLTGYPVMLDIGCGMGEHYPHISEAERESAAYIGIDLDRFKLEHFRENHPEIPLLQATARHLPFAGESADLVQLLATLEHFSVADMGSMVTETLRVLKPGGMLIVSYPAEGSSLLKICQKLMHLYLRARSGFDLDGGDVHKHCTTAGEIRGVLGGRPELQRIETRYYPFGLPWMNLALFVNEQYRKVTAG